MWEYNYSSNAELYHFGTRGMKWGRRLYETEDGNLTPAGKQRYLGDGKTGYVKLKNRGSSSSSRPSTSIKTKNDLRTASSNRPKAKVVTKDSKNTSEKKMSVKAKLKEDYKNTLKKADNAYTNAAKKWDKATKNGMKSSDKANSQFDNAGKKWKSDKKAAKQAYKERMKIYAKTPEGRKETAKKVAKGAAVVAGTALAAYGVYKVSQYSKNAKAFQSNYENLLKKYRDVTITTDSHGNSIPVFRGQAKAQKRAFDESMSALAEKYGTKKASRIYNYGKAMKKITGTAAMH